MLGIDLGNKEVCEPTLSEIMLLAQSLGRQRMGIGIGMSLPCEMFSKKKVKKKKKEVREEVETIPIFHVQMTSRELLAELHVQIAANHSAANSSLQRLIQRPAPCCPGVNTTFCTSIQALTTSLLTARCQTNPFWCCNLLAPIVIEPH
jgi:hypothetical protein